MRLKRIIFRLTLSLLFAYLAIVSIHATVKPARIFCSNMVLQQGLENPIWGWAGKGEKITIYFAGRTVCTKADLKGKWFVRLPVLDYGGPYEMVIVGGDTVKLDNILIGEVWICSGQSNMEFSVASSKNAKSELAAANYQMIRLFSVNKKISQVPVADLDQGEWKTCTPENVKEFSSVAYFFGRKLYQELHVPIGLIQATWGGTFAEGWMSTRALADDPDFRDKIQELEHFNMVKNEEQKVVASRIIRKEIGSKDEGLVNGVAVYADPLLKEAGWKEINPSRPWEEEGYPYVDGIAWYRMTIDLTKDQAGKAAKISLGKIYDRDILWINGIKIGSTVQEGKKRIYRIPDNVLKSGKNIIALRVEDTQGSGGIQGDAKDLYLAVGSDIVSLNRCWKFRITEARNQYTEVDQNYFPTVIFNGMISPLIPFGMKGVIWYQGESNVDRAKQYQRIFPALINDWRYHWNQGSFPFIFVSLANYQKPVELPSESSWAELREAQAMALSLPNTGMAIAIDIGEESDIHPKNKQEVGRRLAFSALSVAYGKTLVSSGPLFQHIRFEGKNAVIRFMQTGSGLYVLNKYGYVNGFSIAGEDHHFKWAKAFIIDENTVLVYSDEVDHPVAVRYGWANNPNDLDLYNKEGFPAHPFRTDDWSGITK